MRSAVAVKVIRYAEVSRVNGSSGSKFLSRIRFPTVSLILDYEWVINDLRQNLERNVVFICVRSAVYNIGKENLSAY